MPFQNINKKAVLQTFFRTQTNFHAHKQIFTRTNTKYKHTQTQNINTHRHKFTQNVPPLSMIDFILIGNVKTIIKALVGGYQWQDIQFFIHFFPVAVKTNGL